MRRLFPHPYLTLTLIVLWFLLVNQWKLGSLVMAAFLGTAIPLLTSAWWPDRARVKHPLGLAAYSALVLWDVIVANFQVARIVLFMPRDRIQSNWITIPLDLRSPEAISLLAGTITMTPGTLTSDMSACGRALLVHALHAPDPDAVRDEIKARYEARLKRIFE
ncbi:Na+/H+ antiporter subunit E [Tabrizicola thermarum]|uniref:Na+/H+ antiporter subunit E n=1 Tax=Tabrizicola thermarum TaxID=2670345 RepID=UPI000FFC7675|nr:Na+/H+ antiporter subunit E [Tabrizicola thermarum]